MATASVAYDTTQVFANDSLPYVDSLLAGMDTMVIYTSVSNFCAQPFAVVVDTPHFTMNGATLSPDYCGANDGAITCTT